MLMEEARRGPRRAVEQTDEASMMSRWSRMMRSYTAVQVVNPKRRERDRGRC